MPLATPTIILGFLLPWVWGISSQRSSKVQPLLLTLDEVYLLTAAPPNLGHGIAPLGPLAPAQPLLLGCGVAPPSCSPWPQTGVSPLSCSCAVAAWHSLPPTLTMDAIRSSGLLPFGHGVLPASAFDVGRGVAPLSHALRAVAAVRIKIHIFKYIAQV